MMLVACTVLDYPPSEPRSFSLIFKADANAPAEQAIYPVSAAQFGPEPLFLVPVAQRENDSHFPLEFQAIFNLAPAPGISP